MGNHFAKDSRHSIGMRVCDRIASVYGCSWHYERQYKAYTASFSFQDQLFVLFKSKWPMNLNGRSIKKIGITLLDETMSDKIFLTTEKFRHFCFFNLKFSWNLDSSDLVPRAHVSALIYELRNFDYLGCR